MSDIDQFIYRFHARFPTATLNMEFLFGGMYAITASGLGGAYADPQKLAAGIGEEWLSEAEAWLDQQH